MLDGDCGILPVVDEGKLVGVVTDRDMYIALATRGKRASHVTVREVVQAPVYTCGPDDDVRLDQPSGRQPPQTRSIDQEILKTISSICQ